MHGATASVRHTRQARRQRVYRKQVTQHAQRFSTTYMQQATTLHTQRSVHSVSKHASLAHTLPVRRIPATEATCVRRRDRQRSQHTCPTVQGATASMQHTCSKQQATTLHTQRSVHTVSKHTSPTHTVPVRRIHATEATGVRRRDRQRRLARPRAW